MTYYSQLGIKANTEALAVGLADMFTDEENAALAFGMLPAAKMETFRDYLTEKLLKDFRRDDPTTKFEHIITPGNSIGPFTINQIAGEIVNEVVNGIYANAEMRV